MLGPGFCSTSPDSKRMRVKEKNPRKTSKRKFIETCILAAQDVIPRSLLNPSTS